MPIVSSINRLVRTQDDGVRLVRQEHTDSTGRVHMVAARVGAGEDLAAYLAMRADSLLRALQRQEIKSAIENNSMPVLEHQTLGEFADRFWTLLRRMQDNNKEKFNQGVWWILERITAGDITDNQARVTFNTAFERSLTSGQWNTLKTNKLEPIAARHVASISQQDDI